LLVAFIDFLLTQCGKVLLRQPLPVQRLLRECFPTLADGGQAQFLQQDG